MAEDSLANDLATLDLGDEEEEAAFLPPVIRHCPPAVAQSSYGSAASIDEPTSPGTPVYRNLAFANMADLQYAAYDDYDEPTYKGGDFSHIQTRVTRGLSWATQAACIEEQQQQQQSSVAKPAVVPRPPEEFMFEVLHCDLFESVLGLLSPHPDLFAAMAVSKAWRDAARATYLHRHVLDVREDLLSAAKHSKAGGTLRLHSGVHLLAAELTIDRPLRLLSLGAANRALGPWAPRNPSSKKPPYEEDVVLVATLHVLLRTRASALVEGVTLCRLGVEVGYPNAVVYAEAGRLSMERCRVTCGGAATSVPQALEAFSRLIATNGEDGDEADAPAAAAASPSNAATNMTTADEASLNAMLQSGPSLPGDDDERMQNPQSGVWIGAAAAAELRHCTIVACMGPGIKIYHGRLHAEDNTVAFSSRGANVVANGGHVTLERNVIHGANGDGVSVWNDSVMHLEGNSIHSNTGAGVAVNTGGGAMTIVKNVVRDNGSSVFFDQGTFHGTLRDNDFRERGRERVTTGLMPPIPSRQRTGASSGGSGGGGEAAEIS